MLIIKIWGSIFAPKNSNKFDLDYLKLLKSELEKVYKDKIIIIHWTWNIWHSFVKKYWINRKTFKLFLKIRKKFFREIDFIFSWYKRILAKKFLKLKNKILNYNKNIIIWGDIINRTLNIISSDLIFSKLISKNTLNIILTDVNWVFDENWKVIEKISLKNISHIKFWEKENDVTWAMKQKILSLKWNINNISKWVWICNWNNLENLKNIIKNWKWIWTFITK